ncbi:hypothetical protein K435DRAFT_962286 [Dendrothele bispora CBS 962.96]|uniref:Uncharacterized protein n=1 Tax=Dendrothele bispora (strain CBS 962.96) TaxID=1314807 RepID=A0A4S8MLM9_DENBC|nr:hypothetical protein K435DRAFT_962286 [Dendrothele bispora CBS 962.96]
MVYDTSNLVPPVIKMMLFVSLVLWKRQLSANYSCSKEFVARLAWARFSDIDPGWHCKIATNIFRNLMEYDALRHVPHDKIDLFRWTRTMNKMLRLPVLACEWKWIKGEFSFDTAARRMIYDLSTCSAINLILGISYPVFGVVVGMERIAAFIGRAKEDWYLRTTEAYMQQREASNPNWVADRLNQVNSKLIEKRSEEDPAWLVGKLTRANIKPWAYQGNAVSSLVPSVSLLPQSGADYPLSSLQLRSNLEVNNRDDSGSICIDGSCGDSGDSNKKSHFSRWRTFLSPSSLLVAFRGH